MTKIYYGRDLIGRFTCDGKKRTKWGQMKYEAGQMYKKCAISASILVVCGYLITLGIFIARGTVEPQVVYAKEVVEVPVESVSPVMERIAKCESGNVHFKNGQVLIRPNTNGTVDIGKYQINSVWNKEASKQGLDLTKEGDNERFAMWLYKNRGTEDWYASRACWR